MLRRLVSLVSLLLLALVLVPAVAAQSNVGLVRVAHASPDAPAVDVYVNDDAVLTNVPFKTVSNYLELAPGTYTFRVAPAGAGADAAVITAEATIAAGEAYTVAAINTLDNIEGTIFSDDLSAPADGQAHVRVYHLSPDAPAVDLKTQDDAVTLVSNLSYPNASEYTPVDAGNYNLKVTAAGDTASVFDVTADAQEGVIYSAFAVGQLGDESLDVVLSAYEVAAELPNTGAADMPVALVASLAGAVIAGGLVLRRRMAA